MDDIVPSDHGGLNGRPAKKTKSVCIKRILGDDGIYTVLKISWTTFVFAEPRSFWEAHFPDGYCLELAFRAETATILEQAVD
jgi:hypothetical protein